MAETTWTQSAGMVSDEDTDNLESYSEQAEASKDAAAVSAAAAEAAKVAAAASEAAALASKNSAATSATTATTGAATATTKASEAAASATSASTSATAAQTAQTAAEAAETAAAASEAGVDADRVAAEAAATAAAASETAAATSATNAATSATNAATSASASATSATASAASATAASASENAADSSAIAAAASETAAATSETNAAASAATATTKASEASASATAAASSASASATSATDSAAARDQSQDARDTANLHTLAAEAAATSATNTAAALTGFDLEAIAESKAVTAVDVFVYDTSKDSDGGAWRKRTQGTSWYNETLSTATRGSRREFPAVAVIVAEADKVTIYDGDDPSLPMWMVFNEGGANALWTNTIAPTSVVMLNGIMCVPQNGSSAGGFNRMFFIEDTTSLMIETTVKYNVMTIADRNRGGVLTVDGSFPSGIVNRNANDVAMTVLPNAPIDAATGLPVPTIAVATDGGVSVIKDDGTVVDSSIVNSSTFVDFNDQQNLLHAFSSSPLVLYIYDNYNADGFSAAPLHQYPRNSTIISGRQNILSAAGGQTDVVKNAVGSALAVTLLAPNDADTTKGMVAYTTSSYNTGWMNGDIKGAFLSDTDDTDLVYSDVAATLGAPWTGPSASYDSGTGYLTYSAQYQSYGIRVTNTADVNGLSNVGKQFYAEIDVKWISGNNTIYFNNYGTVSSSSTIPTDGTTVTLTVQATVVSLGAYNGLFAVLQFRGSSDFPVLEIVDARLTTKDQDRSVNDNGLIVNGTVTRSPVATGADLVAYSGFSASNYLEQPYNSDLDFGTGDFCIMGWVKPDGTNGRTFVSYEGGDGWQLDHYANTLRFWEYTPSGGNKVLASTTATTALQFICVLVSGGVVSMYVNGVLVSTGITTSRSFSNGTLRVGKAHSFLGYNALATQLSLLRISATALTAEQIAKIYNDEKVLFQENAGAVLAGTSDAVTALAYDDDTQELLVGTSQNTSVFRGLRRVETISGSASAISASNGLRVIED